MLAFLKRFARVARFRANQPIATESTTRRAMNHVSAETLFSNDGPLEAALDQAHVDGSPVHVDESPVHVDEASDGTAPDDAASDGTAPESNTDSDVDMADALQGADVAPARKTFPFYGRPVHGHDVEARKAPAQQMLANNADNAVRVMLKHGVVLEELPGLKSEHERTLLNRKGITDLKASIFNEVNKFIHLHATVYSGIRIVDHEPTLEEVAGATPKAQITALTIKTANRAKTSIETITKLWAKYVEARREQPAKHEKKANAPKLNKCIEKRTTKAGKPVKRNDEATKRAMNKKRELGNLMYRLAIGRDFADMERADFLATYPDAAHHFFRDVDASANDDRAVYAQLDSMPILKDFLAMNLVEYMKKHGEAGQLVHDAVAKTHVAADPPAASA